MIPRPRSWDFLTVVAIAVLAFGAAQLVAGALEVGVTTDEPRHTERAMGWIEAGFYVPEEFLIDGEPDPDNDFSSPFVYGPAFAATAHLANVAAGNEAIDEIASSEAAYDVRHLVVALLALLTAAAVGVAVWRLTRSGSFGIWAAAALLSIPRWTGHGFFNLKDIPAATGYTLVTVALVFALLEQPERPTSRARRLAIGATLAAGICIGAGTRISLWVPLIASLLGYAVLRFAQRHLGRIERDRGTDLTILAGAAAGALAIAALYPEAASQPFSLLVESVSNSADYPYQGLTLTAGSLLHEYPPWWYLPAWLGGTIPLLIGVLALFAGFACLRALVDAARGRGRIWRQRRLGALLVLQQALFLPLAAVVGGAVMYSGLRQHLYVLPALAILAGLGAKGLRARFGSSGARGAIATAALCLALLVPMAEQTRLFPYNYTYVNPLGGIRGVDDRWETDYWFASAPEALSRVPRGVELRCSDFLIPGWAPDGGAEVKACEGDQFEPYFSRRGSDVAVPIRVGEDAVWLIARRRAGNLVPGYCEQAGDVTRPLRGEDVTMAFVLRCDPQRIGREESR